MNATNSVCAVIAAAAIIVTTCTDVHAIDKCKVKVDKKTGVILLSASGVGGTLTWGPDAGDETHPFFDSSCVSGTTAKDCTIAAPASLAAKTPPSGCTFYLNDTVAPCQVFVRGCTPKEDVRVRATNSSNFPFTGGLDTLPFDTERYDTANMHDTEVNTSKFIIPSDGTYAVSLNLRHSLPTGSPMFLCISRNADPNNLGNAYDSLIACQTGGNVSSFLTILNVNTVTAFQAGDTLRAMVTGASGKAAVPDSEGEWTYEFTVAKIR